jgi:hypothetical protein
MCQGDPGAVTTFGEHARGTGTDVVLHGSHPTLDGGWKLSVDNIDSGPATSTWTVAARRVPART